MSAFIIRRGSVPKLPKTYTITLTGTGWNSAACYITIDGTNYYSAQTITVTEGTEITCNALNFSSTLAITLNGTKVGTYTTSGSSIGSWKYTHTVTSNLNIIGLMDDNAFTTIQITTS